MLVRLFLTLALVPALHAARISLTTECPQYGTAPTVTFNLSSPGCGTGGTITASDGGYTTAISLNLGTGYGLTISAYASSSQPITLVVGGSGLGYMYVTYTDTIQLGGLWEAESYSGYAGSLSFNASCAGECETAGINETVTSTSGPLAVTNGEQFVPGGSVYLSAGLFSANLQGTLSVTAQVTIVDAWTAEPVASPESVPEPSAFWPGMVLLAAAAVRRATSKLRLS